MKPKLVDIDQFFKDNTKLNPPTKLTKPKDLSPPKIDNTPFNYQSLFNMIGLVIIITGFFFLYKRKENKEMKRKKLESQINKLKGILDQ
tara:strand:+ start:8569 stop:8835 length:267 start_codon:yes stop_codon:yes gene_type:complete